MKNIIAFITSFFDRRSFGAFRSPDWREVRNNFIRYNNKCVVCNTQKGLECHHKFPFHEFPELELNPQNLTTLCKRCHLFIGHLGDYKCYNKAINEDITIWNKKITERNM